jgi:hypothetical protein
MELRSDAALDEGFQFAGIRALDFLPCDAETEHRAPRALIDVLLAPVALDAFRQSHRGNRLAENRGRRLRGCGGREDRTDAARANVDDAFEMEESIDALHFEPRAVDLPELVDARDVRGRVAERDRESALEIVGIAQPHHQRGILALPSLDPVLHRPPRGNPVGSRAQPFINARGADMRFL